MQKRIDKDWFFKKTCLHQIQMHCKMTAFCMSWQKHLIVLIPSFTMPFSTTSFTKGLVARTLPSGINHFCIDLSDYSVKLKLGISSTHTKRNLKKRSNIGWDMVAYGIWWRHLDTRSQKYLFSKISQNNGFWLNFLS